MNHFNQRKKPSHSTETALLRVKNDIVSAIDDKNAVFMVMLDLSAAFDTIDHEIFVNRLCHTFHIKGRAQDWFASYLQNRKSCVCLAGEFSAEHVMSFGLPQGSILGPRRYQMYTHPIGDILRRYNVRFHIYADDTQIYVTFDPRIPGEYERALERLRMCVREIKAWMRQNKLQLNEEKTEFCIFKSSRSTFDITNIKLVLDDVTIEPTLTLKNLGVIFDPALNMSSQVSSIVKRVSYHLRNLSRIRQHLDQDTCKKAVQSLLLSRMDNGNALLFGTTEHDLTRLQRLQNRAASSAPCVTSSSLVADP